MAAVRLMIVLAALGASILYARADVPRTPDDPAIDDFLSRLKMLVDDGRIDDPDVVSRFLDVKWTVSIGRVAVISSSSRCYPDIQSSEHWVNTRSKFADPEFWFVGRPRGKPITRNRTEGASDQTSPEPARETDFFYDVSDSRCDSAIQQQEMRAKAELGFNNVNLFACITKSDLQSHIPNVVAAASAERHSDSDGYLEFDYAGPKTPLADTIATFFFASVSPCLIYALVRETANLPTEQHPNDR